MRLHCTLWSGVRRLAGQVPRAIVPWRFPTIPRLGHGGAFLPELLLRTAHAVRVRQRSPGLRRRGWLGRSGSGAVAHRGSFLDVVCLVGARPVEHRVPNPVRRDQLQRVEGEGHECAYGRLHVCHGLRPTVARTRALAFCRRGGAGCRGTRRHRPEVCRQLRDSLDTSRPGGKARPGRGRHLAAASGSAQFRRCSGEADFARSRCHGFGGPDPRGEGPL
mmetsp:Transcript_117881/g.338041  ORF Transcript_117881/g.338041 Transcript_117881/m.338041 type:complete len:219 (+) Transcript_117881:304-960(+)